MQKRVHRILDELFNDNIKGNTLFKYHRINKFLYDVIVNSELWFSDPFSFNDPFDCNLTIDGNNTPQQIKQYYKVAHWKKSKETDTEIQKLIETNFCDRDAFKRKINGISKKVIGSLGVTCFTEGKDNLLMWAHYTEEHKGAVLEFDYKKDVNFFRPLKKVEYAGKYPAYNYYNDKNNVVSQLMLRKSDHWKYEKEVRLIKHTTGPQAFNPRSLVAIYFGVRTPKKQVGTLSNLIESMEKYSHVNIYTTKLNETDYKLDFVKIR